MKKTLDSNAIKLVAIAAMTVDHVAWWLFPGYPRAVLPLAMHIIGRLTCPIMCYFVAEGYHHTRDIRKYTARMFLFAVISHFAYVFASADFAGWRSFIPFSSGSVLNQTSVMWSLAWGLVMLRVVHDRRLRPAVQVALILLICLVSFPADWSCIAALCIMAFGTNRGKLKTQALWMMFYVALYAVVYALALDWVYGLVQLAVVLAVPVLALYNGQRGPSPRVNTVMKWLFYLYYPAHLALIGWCKCNETQIPGTPSARRVSFVDVVGLQQGTPGRLSDQSYHLPGEDAQSAVPTVQHPQLPAELGDVYGVENKLSQSIRRYPANEVAGDERGAVFQRGHQRVVDDRIAAVDQRVGNNAVMLEKPVGGGVDHLVFVVHTILKRWQVLHRQRLYQQGRVRIHKIGGTPGGQVDLFRG